MVLRGDRGLGYVRLDWFTPDGLVDHLSGSFATIDQPIRFCGSGHDERFGEIEDALLAGDVYRYSCSFDKHQHVGEPSVCTSTSVSNSRR